MFSKALGREIREDALAPAYLIHGDEGYLADLFVRELSALLDGGGSPELRVERFYLEETGWAEILDTARTAPFLFSSWRVLFVSAPEPKEDDEKARKKEEKLLTDADRKLLARYFADPAARTVLVLHFPGNAKRMGAPARFLSGLAGVVTRAAFPLKPKDAKAWMAEKARSMGKTLLPEAADRLLELVGSDLRRLDNELEKLAVFAGEEKAITAAAVEQASAWVRDFDRYDLSNAMEAGSLKNCLTVLGQRLEAGEKPEQVVAKLTGVVRDVLNAKVRLTERGEDRKAIFKSLFPQVPEEYRDLYRRKFGAFFGFVDGLTMAEIRGLANGLSEADARNKSTDVERRTVLEAFLFEYCRLWRIATSRASERAWRPGG